jgi:hypothetical protein
MDNCCVVDHKRKKCVDIGFDDSHCTCLSKSCVGIHNFGLHNKCTSAVRKCRKLGNAWDPIAPLHPLPHDYLYTETPGYATTGNFIEHFDAGFLDELFDVQCVVKNSACSLVIALVAKAVLGTKVSVQQLVLLTLVISLVKCCIAKL